MTVGLDTNVMFMRIWIDIVLLAVALATVITIAYHAIQLFEAGKRE